MNEARQWARAMAVIAVAIAGATSTGAPVRGETIRGSVRTQDGTPAVGARVWTAKLWTDILDRRETVADEEGRFTLEVAPGSWWVWAAIGTQAGAGSREVKVQAGREVEPIALSLREAGRLRGRLLEAE